MPLYAPFNGGTIRNPLIISQGTITTNAPQIDGTVSWNNAGVTFTAWKLNATSTASASGSLLLDLQHDSTSRWAFGKSGFTTITGTGSNAGPVTIDITQSSKAVITANRNLELSAGSGWSITAICSGGFLLSDTGNAYIRTDASDILALRNLTTAQAFRVYNTFTSSTNYERCTVDWKTVANQCNIGTEKGSGGGTARALGIQTDATVRLLVGASGGFTVTDANDFAFGTTTGTKIGTATSQKLGFYNATPIVQGASVADASGGAVIDAEARTAINALISRIEALGLIATV